jgi:hypothetical protein
MIFKKAILRRNTYNIITVIVLAQGFLLIDHILTYNVSKVLTLFYF